MSIQNHYSHSGEISGGFGINVLTGMYTGTSQQVGSPIPPGGAGTFRNWKIQLDTAPGPGKSKTYTLQKNNVNTGITITISGTDLAGSSTGVDVHYADGDLIDAAWTTSGGPGLSDFVSVLEYEPDVDGTLIFGWCGGSATNSNPHISPFSGQAWVATARTFDGTQIVGLDGSVIGMACRSSSAPTGGNTWEFALYKNGTKQDGSGGSVDTRLTVTNPNVGTSATFDLPVVFSDDLRVTYNESATGATYDLGTIAFLLDDTGSPGGGSIGMIAMNGRGASTTGIVRYNHPRGGSTVWDNSEAPAEYIGGVQPITFTGMIAEVSQAPGSGNGWTITLRKNGADTAITLDIEDAATTGQMEGESVIISSSDRWALSIVAIGSPAVGTSGSADNHITLNGGPMPEESRRNLLTGSVHTVEGSDNLIVGTLGTVDAANLVALFSLDGAAHSEDRNHTFCVHADNICLNGTVEVNGTPVSGRPIALDDLSDVVIAAPATDDVLTYNGSEWVNAPPTGGGSPGTSAAIVTRKAADETVNNSSAFQNDNHFAFSIGANDVYLVELTLLLQSASTASDYKFQWVLPAGGTYYIAPNLLGSNAAIGSVVFQWDPVLAGSTPTALSTTVTAAGSAASGVCGCFIRSILINSSTGGTAQFQWAQNSATVADSKILANSVMIRWLTT